MPRVVYTTERGLVHQQRALAAAPPELSITMLRQPDTHMLYAALQQADYLISERVGVVDAQIFMNAPRLKLLVRVGSLYHDIDLAAARVYGVTVCRHPDPGTESVAEHCILQMLALTRKLRQVEQAALAPDPRWGESRQTDENVFAYNWSGQRGLGRIEGRTVGILGMGEIGVEVARRLTGWGCVILYHKRRRLPESVERELNITYVDSKQLLVESDYLVSLLPYLPETVNYLNLERIDWLKSGAFVLSCGSGGTFDEAVLAQAVQNGRIAGVAVDSYAWEPLRADNSLLALARAGANVLLTPHIAAGTEFHSGREYSNILRHLRGEPLLYRLI
jgi:lactate dehydrogenase-like 2-hydroxyacid dehydrogenase